MKRYWASARAVNGISIFRLLPRPAWLLFIIYLVNANKMTLLWVEWIIVFTIRLGTSKLSASPARSRGSLVSSSAVCQRMLLGLRGTGPHLTPVSACGSILREPPERITKGHVSPHPTPAFQLESRIQLWTHPNVHRRLNPWLTLSERAAFPGLQQGAPGMRRAGWMFAQTLCVESTHLMRFKKMAACRNFQFYFK